MDYLAKEFVGNDLSRVLFPHISSEVAPSEVNESIMKALNITDQMFGFASATRSRFRILNSGGTDCVIVSMFIPGQAREGLLDDFLKMTWKLNSEGFIASSKCLFEISFFFSPTSIGK